MATHSHILAWKIPWTEEPGGYSSWGCKELDLTEWLSPHTLLYRGSSLRKPLLDHPTDLVLSPDNNSRTIIESSYLWSICYLLRMSRPCSKGWLA